MQTLPPLLNPPIRFSAATIHGAGRGRRLKIPTINLNTAAAPAALTHGIYACRIRFAGQEYGGSMHFGPRPVFRDSESLEVHVLDTVVTEFPSEVEVDVLARLRDVAMFDTAQELQEAIAHDIALTRGILAACPSDRR